MSQPQKSWVSSVKLALAKPGKRYPVHSSQQLMVSDEPSSSDGTSSDLSHHQPNELRPSAWFESFTTFAGSTTMMIIILVVILAWIIVGIIFKAPTTWQIVMNDSSSIQVYITNTLLIHQQFYNHHRTLRLFADMRSRSLSVREIITSLLQCRVPTCHHSYVTVHHHKSSQLTTESTYDKWVNRILATVGSWYSIAIYWTGIVIWLGLGNSVQWDNNWQLVINTATAVELTFTTVFLQHVRHRQLKFIETSVDLVKAQDERLLEYLRLIGGCVKQEVPEVEIPSQRLGFAHRFIDYYAAVLGGIPGMTLFVAVLISWLGVGHIMQWSSNWWLIFGTYTGLVSFIDEFVLRNIQMRDNEELDVELSNIVSIDSASLTALDNQSPSPASLPQDTNAALNLTQRMFQIIVFSVSCWQSVIASFVFTFAVIFVASGMRWNLTGQLICNTPTMIIEGYLMIILLYGQHSSITKRGIQFDDILLQRTTLFSKLEALYPLTNASSNTLEIDKKT
ncbi:iron/zinc ion transporter [Penicillium lagena]|uniref:iron/zinc ion transporter n=1 Tax=Penicillium lagena TaxID=94218 RepID=UPI002540A0DA|nr:iron/zinc ion transporter [Penicillium lagena]KAJ5604340.1 iron/zinc ion transporter [Penicillium lagena]